MKNSWGAADLLCLLRLRGACSQVPDSESETLETSEEIAATNCVAVGRIRMTMPWWSAKKSSDPKQKLESMKRFTATFADTLFEKTTYTIAPIVDPMLSAGKSFYQSLPYLACQLSRIDSPTMKVQRCTGSLGGNGAGDSMI